MIEVGYIKLFRSLLNWEWYSDVNATRLFIHLLLTVNYEDKKWKGITIKRGQRVASVNTLSIETRLSSQNIRTAINRLKLTNEITNETTSKYSLFTVVNYDKFQEVTSEITNNQQATNKQLTNNQQASNKQITNEQQTSNKQLTTMKESKEVNKVKENKKYISSYEDIVNLFNSICVNLPKVQKLTKTRKKKIKGAKEYIENFEELFSRVQNSDFLSGRSGVWDKCNFDWIIEPRNLIKIIEGNYNNKNQLTQKEGKDNCSFNVDKLMNSSIFDEE